MTLPAIVHPDCKASVEDVAALTKWLSTPQRVPAEMADQLDRLDLEAEIAVAAGWRPQTTTEPESPPRFTPAQARMSAKLLMTDYENMSYAELAAAGRRAQQAESRGRSKQNRIEDIARFAPPPDSPPPPAPAAPPDRPEDKLSMRDREELAMLKRWNTEGNEEAMTAWAAQMSRDRSTSRRADRLLALLEETPND